MAVLVMMAGFLFVPVLGSFGVPGEAIVLGYLGLTFVLVSLFLVMAKITGQDAAVVRAGFAALYAGELAGTPAATASSFWSRPGRCPTPSPRSRWPRCARTSSCSPSGISAPCRSSCAMPTASTTHAVSSPRSTGCRSASRDPSVGAQGAHGERIAAEFFISKSTVDTHLRRIYVKTGTHGRQELIDLGERTQDLARRG
ncbi:MAG: LuxR C-terminal-related transcriptional regulator [Eggerthella lenta]